MLIDNDSISCSRILMQNGYDYFKRCYGHPGAGMQARRVITLGRILQPRFRFRWHIISRALDIPV